MNTKSWLAPVIMFASLMVMGAVLDVSTTAYTQLIVIYILANAIMALGLNLVNGFTGQFSLGHAGFMAIGAYVSAALAMPDLLNFKPFSGSFDFLNFPIYSVLGGLVAALAGWFVGLPSLRLKGDYLAIVTLGFGEIIRVFILNLDVIGGARGLFGVPGPKPLYEGGSPFLSSFLVASFWMVVAFFFHWRMVHSTQGRACMSVRDDEIAAEAMGVNTTRIKVSAFVISSFFAGVGGSLFAHASHYLNPSSFTFARTVDFIIMVVLGGMGSLTGSVLAAAAVTVLPELVLRPLQELTKIDLRMVIYSLTLILFMVLRPQGIFGHREITQFFKRRPQRDSNSSSPPQQKPLESTP